ncbi:adhesin [Thermosulfuriphilus ammonigenes]|uniref:Adhesin n=1 Tax=Thermosulfuriphilus ammonigenes TaxID=1936021 RepID=A0A6G7PTP4_9BACT|nr:IscA/HesB family protein [Thermosulfuriphilus ammonigenes]MBA2848856.1 Fe-S cluster assembly iron-binding protein IscA [Thermosulfuriphilus ammonigenes]QIJ71022.1 adhesin [Thermosulfuriphilus ammonigenes]
MLQVTPTAISKIKEFISANKVSGCIRVTLMGGGCMGPSLGLVLDESRPGDKEFEIDGLTFVVNDSLLDHTGQIKVDFIEADDSCGCGCGGSGFSISSEKELASGCGSSCGAGGCC